MRRGWFVAAALLALGGCVPRAEQAPRPAAPAPVTTPSPVVQAPDWMDWPVAPGNWSYVQSGRVTEARFTSPAGGLLGWLRCDLTTRTVALGRAVAGGQGAMTVRTTFGVLQWPAAPAGTGTQAVRGASDAGLDQIAFSRGRFTLELPGAPPLVLPSWAEPARVIEDCRG